MDPVTLLYIIFAIGLGSAVEHVTAPPPTQLVCQIQDDGKTMICEKRPRRE